MEKVDLRNFDFDELKAYITETFEERPYRAQQIYDWLYKRGATSFNDMTNLAKDLREKLDETCTIDPLPITKIKRSEDGTEKLQFTLNDGHAVEAVLIPGDDRLTLCISSQVGCAMGCRFCFTGSMQLTRNLSTAEIIDQYRGALRHLGGDEERISNVVFMGMGEPLANLENVARACNLLMHDRAYNLSSRRVVVSTSGLVPKIAKLSEMTNASLAISLNATTDAQRTEIMPVNKRYPLADLIAALMALPTRKRKRLLLEYVMLGSFNDRDDDARRLAKIALRIGAKINLIPFNPHDAADFRRPSEDRVLAFQQILMSQGITTFIRQSRGQEIYGACGMLGKGKQLTN